MQVELASALIGLFCTVASSVVTFLLTKRKYNTEVEASQIDNMQKSFNTYKEMMEETVKAQDLRIEGIQKENENLRRENESLRNQIYQLQAQMMNFMIGKKFGLDNIDTNLPNNM